MWFMVRSLTIIYLSMERSNRAMHVGRNWDRVEEMVEANQQRLEAWKASRMGNGAKASRTIFPSSSDSASSSSAAAAAGAAAAGSSGKKKRGRCGGSDGEMSLAKSSPGAPVPLAVPATGPGAAAAAAASTEEQEPGREKREGRGEVVEIGEDAIDLLLGGLPGAAVENGKAASVPGLE